MRQALKKKSANTLKVKGKTVNYADAVLPFSTRCQVLAFTRRARDAEIRREDGTSTRCQTCYESLCSVYGNAVLAEFDATKAKNRNALDWRRRGREFNSLVN